MSDDKPLTIMGVPVKWVDKLDGNPPPNEIVLLPSMMTDEQIKEMRLKFHEADMQAIERWNEAQEKGR